MRDTSPGVLVDVGAGTGRFSTVAPQHSVVAVEPSPAMRAFGMRGAAPGLRWCAGTGEQVPLATSSVDGAMIVTALEWATDPQAWIDEVHRVVRTGGWLVVVILCALSPFAALYRHLGDGGVEPWRSARFFTRDVMAELVGSPPGWAEGTVHLAPQAREPFSEADESGIRAGNPPALEVLRWNIT